MFSETRRATELLPQFGGLSSCLLLLLAMHRTRSCPEYIIYLLNYDGSPYEHSLSVLEQVIEKGEAHAAPRAFMDVVRDLSTIPYYHFFLSDLHELNVGPVEAFVSGVSLGKSREVDAPQVDIQYAVLELDEDHHELVEKLYFDRLEDFVYVELMRRMQRGFVPKQCANCGRWFLQKPDATYNYCDQPAPNSEDGKTCRAVGSIKSFRDKVQNNGVWTAHQRAYRKYFAKVTKGTMTKQERKAIVDQLSEELNRV